jgi:hypothetical protein
MITAHILADSISNEGHRLTTFQYKVHRYVLAELNTHRIISKNARSSRAVPVTKTIEEVRTDPAMPVFWGKNRPGMVATEEVTPETVALNKARWERVAHDATTWAQIMSADGIHKQTVNRLLEPFMWAHGVLSATEWGNFFALRTAADAQPEFKALADVMLDAYRASTPKPLRHGEWHLPYITEEERGHLSVGELQLVSAARVARVSYAPFDGNGEIEKEMERARRLTDAGHWSPFEHQGTPDFRFAGIKDGPWANPRHHANFTGWIQLRKLYPGESRSHPDCP